MLLSQLLRMSGNVEHSPFNVLFLCTGNSARSILAESLLRQLGRGNFNTLSAGSFPKGEVHPMALKREVDAIGRLRPDTAEDRAS
jgi:Low molecular weight phosphotyrosine protein phosphatase